MSGYKLFQKFASGFLNWSRLPTNFQKKNIYHYQTYLTILRHNICMLMLFDFPPLLYFLKILPRPIHTRNRKKTNNHERKKWLLMEPRECFGKKKVHIRIYKLSVICVSWLPMGTICILILVMFVHQNRQYLAYITFVLDCWILVDKFVWCNQ